MEIVYLIVNIIGLIILGWYQRYRIKALKTQVETQNGILNSQNKLIESSKMYVDMYQPDKIDKVVKMRETRFEDEKNEEIGEIKSEWGKKASKE